MRSSPQKSFGSSGCAYHSSATTTKNQRYEDLLGQDPAASVEWSKQLIGHLMGVPDYEEGVRALIEKRPPRIGRPA
jgi:hypothetical protein